MKETKKEITELLIYEYNPLHLIIFYSLGLSFTKKCIFLLLRNITSNSLFIPLCTSANSYIYLGGVYCLDISS